MKVKFNDEPHTGKNLDESKRDMFEGYPVPPRLEDIINKDREESTEKDEEQEDFDIEDEQINN